jgi:hypothetical protein
VAGAGVERAADRRTRLRGGEGEGAAARTERQSGVGEWRDDEGGRVWNDWRRSGGGRRTQCPCQPCRTLLVDTAAAADSTPSRGSCRHWLPRPAAAAQGKDMCTISYKTIS